MRKFARELKHIDALTEWHRNQPDNLLQRYFDRWALPGEPLTAGRNLRLAIRDGYFNFYYQGQSLAKVDIGSRGPKLAISQAYYLGRSDDPEIRNQQIKEQRSESLSADDPRWLSLSEADLANWIAASRNHQKDEKCFVDDLVGANYGVIDLEMALPANAKGDPAPRMDLIIARSADAGVKIEFWEAKCSTNKELRAVAPIAPCPAATHGYAGPQVYGQLMRYEHWVRSGERLTEVRDAVKSTARWNLALFDLFCTKREAEPACLGLWHQLASCDDLKVVVRPGVVVADYDPVGQDGLYAKKAASFGPHKTKLEDEGITVHSCKGRDQTLILPSLPVRDFSA